MEFQAARKRSRPEILYSNASPPPSAHSPLRDLSGNANCTPDANFSFNSPPEPASAPSNYLRPKPSSASITDYDQPLYEARVKGPGGSKIWQWQRIPGALTASEQGQDRYKAYRTRQRKDKDKNGDTVWSEELEDAFQIAIRAIPPILGKKKLQITMDGTTKQYGRNELLAWKIKKLTGQGRRRKQISSHIQVIKGFHSPDSEVVQYIKTDTGKLQAASSKIITFDVERGELVVTDPLASSHTPNVKLEVASSLYPPPIRTLGSSALPPRSTIQEVEFNMSVRSSTVTKDAQLKPIIEPWHVCTRVQSRMGAQPKTLAESDDYQDLFPDLLFCLTDKMSINCEVLLFEASIDLMRTTPPMGSSVFIEFNVNIHCKEEFHSWQVRSTFYEDKGSLASQPRSSVTAQRNKDHKIMLEIPFMSKWWVELFGKAMARRQEIEQRESKKLQGLGHGQCDCHACKALHEDTERALGEEDSNCRRYFREMSIMQELFATRTDSDRYDNGSERIAIFLWRFHRTRPSEAASTTWRKLTQTMDAKAEHSNTTQHSMIVDPALQHTNPDTFLSHAPTVAHSSMIDTELPSAWDDSWVNVAQELYGSSDTAEGSFDEIFHHQIDCYPHPPQPQLTPSNSTLSSNDASRSFQQLSFSSLTSSHTQSQNTIYASECSSQGMDELVGRDRRYHSGPVIASQSSHQYHAIRDYQQMDSEQGLQLEGLEFSSLPRNDAHDLFTHGVTNPRLLPDFAGAHQMPVPLQEPQASTPMESVAYNHCPHPEEYDPQSHSNPLQNRDNSSPALHAPQPRHPISTSRLTTPDRGLHELNPPVRFGTKFHEDAIAELLRQNQYHSLSEVDVANEAQAKFKAHIAALRAQLHAHSAQSDAYRMTFPDAPNAKEAEVQIEAHIAAISAQLGTDRTAFLNTATAKEAQVKMEAHITALCAHLGIDRAQLEANSSQMYDNQMDFLDTAAHKRILVHHVQSASQVLLGDHLVEELCGDTHQLEAHVRSQAEAQARARSETRLLHDECTAPTMGNRAISQEPDGYENAARVVAAELGGTQDGMPEGLQDWGFLDMEDEYGIRAVEEVGMGVEVDMGVEILDEDEKRVEIRDVDR